MNKLPIMILASLFYSSLMADLTVPLLDGDCGEYESLETSTYSMSPEVTLSIFQDASYLWLCYSLPPQSFGTLDLEVQAPGLQSSLNLHVSAPLMIQVE